MVSLREEAVFTVRLNRNAKWANDRVLKTIKRATRSPLSDYRHTTPFVAMSWKLPNVYQEGTVASSTRLNVFTEIDCRCAKSGNAPESGENVLDDFAMDVRQPKVSPLELVCQALVVDTQQVQKRCV